MSVRVQHLAGRADGSRVIELRVLANFTLKGGDDLFLFLFIYLFILPTRFCSVAMLLYKTKVFFVIKLELHKLHSSHFYLMVCNASLGLRNVRSFWRLVVAGSHQITRWMPLLGSWKR